MAGPYSTTCSQKPTAHRACGIVLKSGWRAKSSPQVGLKDLPRTKGNMQGLLAATQKDDKLVWKQKLLPEHSNVGQSQV